MRRLHKPDATGQPAPAGAPPAPADTTPPPAVPAPAEGTPVPAAASDQAGAPAAGEKAFTQADVDRILTERLSRAKTAHDKEMEDFKALAGLNEVERYKLEAQQATDKVTATTEAASARAIAAEVKAAALIAGVKPDVLEYVLRLVDTSAVVVTDLEPDAEAVKAAVAKVLSDMPALIKPGPAAPGRTGSDFQGGEGAPSFTKEQIAAMSVEEFDKNHDAIMRWMSAPQA